MVVALVNRWLQEESGKELEGEHPLIPAVRAYAAHVLDATQLEPECLWTAMHYINRVRENGSYKINRETFCILFATCLMLATKFLHDKPSPVAFWAELCGFDIRSINNAERLVLRSLKWHLLIDTSVHESLMRSAMHANRIQNVTADVASLVL